VTDRMDFEKTLSVCLDKLRDGDTVEACLARYPSQAGRLAPLLQVAARLQPSSSPPTMSPEGFRRVESRLLAHANGLRAGQRGASSARRGLLSSLLPGTRRLVTATLASLLLLCGLLSAGTVSAASTSLPGSPLYSVKRVTETLVSSMAFTPKLKTRAHLTWAERRLREAEALVARDALADESVLAALEYETRQALAAAEQAGLDQVAAVILHTERQQMVLNQLLDEAPQAARPGLERALAVSAQGNARARSAWERAAGPGPPQTPPGRVDKKPPHTEPSAVDAAADTPGTVDKPYPPGNDHGQGVGPAEGEGNEPGKGQGQAQDEAGDPDRGQGRGGGPDKDKKHPPGNDKDQGGDLDPGKNPGQDGNHGQGKGQGPPPTSSEGNGKGRGQGQGSEKDTGKDK